MTQTNNSTISDAVFLSAWTEFCRTNGSQEYLRRYGDYLFRDPPREIPRELLSLPPGYRPPPKRRHQRQRPPDGLRTASEAAAKLGCSVKTLNGYVAAGTLKYVAIGHGSKRPRKMFTDADLNQFIADQTREALPCPSPTSRARHTGTSNSKCEVIDFAGPRKPPTGAKRKK